MLWLVSPETSEPFFITPVLPRVIFSVMAFGPGNWVLQNSSLTCQLLAPCM